MPDVTVTPTTQTVTVNTGHVTINDPIYVDEARATQFSLFTDGATAGTFNAYTAFSATVTYRSTCEADSVCYAQLQPAINTAGSRCWLSERPSTTDQPCILAGVYEMECSARVKVDKNGTTVNSYRIGFFNGHVPPVDPPEDINAIHFQVFGSESTWHVMLAVNGGFGDASESVILEDTGIACADWHVLRVWVNAAGTSAEFYIDGDLVYQSNNASHIPTAAIHTMPRTSGYWMQSGAVIRATDGFGTPSQPTLYVDWLQTIIRADRSS